MEISKITVPKMAATIYTDYCEPNYDTAALTYCDACVCHDNAMGSISTLTFFVNIYRNFSHILVSPFVEQMHIMHTCSKWWIDSRAKVNYHLENILLNFLPHIALHSNRHWPLKLCNNFGDN